MTGQFGVDDAGLHALSELHGGVAEGLGKLADTDAPHSGGIPQSFGHIASSMNQALGGTLARRGDTFQNAQHSSDTIAGHLQQAHDMYTRTAETVAHDITKGFDDVADGGQGGRHGIAGGNHSGANGVPSVSGTPGETDGARAGSSGTPVGGSSGTPAGAATPGGPSSGSVAAPLDAPTSAVPTSTHDASGGVGGAASIGQPLSQVIDQSAQQAGAAGQAAGQGRQGVSHTQGQLPQQIAQAATQLGGTDGGELGAIGASAQAAQDLVHRSEAPAGDHDASGAEPPDDAEPDEEPPGDDSQPDDQQLPADQTPQFPAPQRPHTGRTDSRKL